MTPGDAGHGARHLVGDVQRFGLLSAAAVVDRYQRIVDRAIAGAAGSARSAGSAGSAGSAAAPPLSADGLADGLADSAAGLARAALRVLDAAANLVEGPAATGRDVLELPAAQPGATIEVSLWVHNPTASPATGVEVHVTDFVSGHGSRIAAEAVSFSPERVPRVAPGGREEIRLRLAVPTSQPAGRYHGVVLSSAGPGDALAVRLDVLAEADRDRGDHG